MQVKFKSLLLFLVFCLPAFPASAQSARDTTLSAVRGSESRDGSGKLLRLSVGEHLRRATVYMSNREFAEAREHWQAVLNFYPADPAVADAMLGIGRSFLQSRRYAEAAETLGRLTKQFPETKAGREGLNFSAAALLRLGKPNDAVDRYTQYISNYPNGERIDTAHLNVIDTLREAGRPRDALTWITRTTQRFAGTVTETNALFAQLRLHIAEGEWRDAVRMADDLSRRSLSRTAHTTPGEVAYLKAYALERSGDRRAAITAYLAIPDSIDSYYGSLATERLLSLVDGQMRETVEQRLHRVRTQAANSKSQFPALYRTAILRAARARKLDPRFILAIIKQESVFKPMAKSPAGARGLLQLTIDAAERYAKTAGINSLRETDLYRPETSILLGSEYLADLASMFPKMLEPVAASYNGGEDNVARWAKRAKQKDAGVFTAEIGFEETKGYVQKVMNNYRAYRQIYTEDLVPR